MKFVNLSFVTFAQPAFSVKKCEKCSKLIIKTSEQAKDDIFITRTAYNIPLKNL